MYSNQAELPHLLESLAALGESVIVCFPIASAKLQPFLKPTKFFSKKISKNFLFFHISLYFSEIKFENFLSKIWGKCVATLKTPRFSVLLNQGGVIFCAGPNGCCPTKSCCSMKSRHGKAEKRRIAPEFGGERHFGRFKFGGERKNQMIFRRKLYDDMLRSSRRGIRLISLSIFSARNFHPV